jgi:hypothetical protein
MDQAGVLVDADMDFHREIPLIALVGLVHFRIPLALLVFRGGWCRDQGGINDRALPHLHAPRPDVGFDDLKNLLTQPVLLQQVTEAQDHGLGACCLKTKRPQATIFDLRRQLCARHLLLIVEPFRLMGSAIPPTLWVGGLLLIPLPSLSEPSGNGIT